MKARTTSRGGLYLFCVLLTTLLNINAQKKVLFYGSTHVSGGIAETLVNNSAGEFAPIGSGSAVWTPGHSSASLDWSRKTTAHFAAFDAIVFSDPDEMHNPAPWAAAIANRAVWSAALTGNILFFARRSRGPCSR